MAEEKILYFECMHELVKPFRLTNYVRRHGIEKHAGNISLMFKKCDIDDHIGGLPPELINLVKGENISEKTACFFDIIDDFIYVNRGKMHAQMTYDMSEIGALFNTNCFLQTYEKDINGEKYYWKGTFSDVYKICFPEIGVSYALKIFKHNERNDTFGTMFKNGPIYEIVNGFCACKLEPKFNNRVYMAKLINREYMISEWQNTKSDSYIPAEGPFAIYTTTDRERNKNNYINGLRVDFGETEKTPYGKLSHKGRKFYRQMYYMRDVSEIQRIYRNLKTTFDRYDFENAFKVFVKNFGQQDQSIRGQDLKIQNRRILHIQQIQNLMHR